MGETYGLEGGLWRLGPVAARGVSDGAAVTLDEGVYMVLTGADGIPRLAPGFGKGC